jgi:hypothetical protein
VGSPQQNFNRRIDVGWTASIMYMSPGEKEDRSDAWYAVFPIDLGDVEANSAFEVADIARDRMREAVENGRIDVSHTQEWPNAIPGNFAQEPPADDDDIDTPDDRF